MRFTVFMTNGWLGYGTGAFAEWIRLAFIGLGWLVLLVPGIRGMHEAGVGIGHSRWHRHGFGFRRRLSFCIMSTMLKQINTQIKNPFGRHKTSNQAVCGQALCGC